MRQGYGTIPSTSDTEYSCEDDDLSTDDESAKSEVSSDVIITLTEATPKSEDDAAKY